MNNRRAGYVMALKDLGIADERIVAHGGLPLSMQDGAEALTLMLKKWPEVDAVFCASDSAAFGALMECHRRGMKVPKELAIAGFGNFEVSRNSHPRLTTVGVNAYNVGLSAGQLILEERAAGVRRGTYKPKSLLLSFEICERESA